MCLAPGFALYMEISNILQRLFCPTQKANCYVRIGWFADNFLFIIAADVQMSTEKSS